MSLGKEQEEVEEVPEEVSKNTTRKTGRGKDHEWINVKNFLTNKTFNISEFLISRPRPRPRPRGGALESSTPELSSAISITSPPDKVCWTNKTQITGPSRAASLVWGDSVSI